MKSKKCHALGPLVKRCEELLLENQKLKEELAREKEINRNYWSSIVWLRSSEEFKVKPLPCPFCGSTDVGLEGSTCDAEWLVMCECGAMGPTQHSENAALRAWNKAARVGEKEEFQQEPEQNAESEVSEENNNQPTETGPSPVPESDSSSELLFQYDADFCLVGKYRSISEACNTVGYKYAGAIGKALNGTVYTAAGYFWTKGYRPLRKLPDKWKAAAQKLKSEN